MHDGKDRRSITVQCSSYSTLLLRTAVKHRRSCHQHVTPEKLPAIDDRSQTDHPRWTTPLPLASDTPHASPR